MDGLEALMLAGDVGICAGVVVGVGKSGNGVSECMSVCGAMT